MWASDCTGSGFLQNNTQKGPTDSGSPWCLAELALMFANDAKIDPVFYHVPPSVPRHCTGSYAEAFRKHELKGRYGKEQIDEWTAALHKASLYSGWEHDLHVNMSSEHSRHSINRGEEEIIFRSCRTPSRAWPSCGWLQQKNGRFCAREEEVSKHCRNSGDGRVRKNNTGQEAGERFSLVLRLEKRSSSALRFYNGFLGYIRPGWWSRAFL